MLYSGYDSQIGGTTRPREEVQSHQDHDTSFLTYCTLILVAVDPDPGIAVWVAGVVARSTENRVSCLSPLWCQHPQYIEA